MFEVVAGEDLIVELRPDEGVMGDELFTLNEADVSLCDERGSVGIVCAVVLVVEIEDFGIEVEASASEYGVAFGGGAAHEVAGSMLVRQQRRSRKDCHFCGSRGAE